MFQAIVINKQVKEIVVKCLRILKRALYFGKTHYCPICRSSVRKFLDFGITPRANALCPVCGSLERHRLDWQFFTNKTNLFDGSPKKFLHVAPEDFFEPLFKAVPNLDYLSADLFNPRAMVKMDIMDIQFPDASFDVIYCSHVLEHVPDDLKAMREFYRVLKPSGWAVLQVPIVAKKTYEDLSIKSPEDRIRVFGHSEHVRNYGPDYQDRLVEAGFHVSVVTSNEIIGKNNLFRFGVKDNDVIYYCKK